MMIKNIGFLNNGGAVNFSSKINKGDSSQNKIEPNSAFSAKLSSAHANLAKKTDRIELSQHSVERRRTLSEVRNDILNDINTDTQKNRIEELKKQVSTNQYTINASEIANIMLLY